MSLTGALNSGVSGLRANSDSIGIISDNIANANTVGYKGSIDAFETLVTQSASSTAYAPGGVLSHPFAHVDQQGLLTASSSSSDVGIAGHGFFIVSGQLNPDNTISPSAPRDFTRAGSFVVDKLGNLVNTAGQYLLGVKTDTSGVPLTSTAALTDLVPVNVGTLTGLASGTTKLSIGANLPATPTVDSPLKLSGQLAVPPVTISDTNGGKGYVVYSSNGNAYLISTLTYAANGTAGYTVQINSAADILPIGVSKPIAATAAFPLTLGSVSFDASGAATLASGGGVPFADGSIYKPSLDITQLRSGGVTALNAVSVDPQSITTTVYDSLGVAHNLTLEFFRDQKTAVVPAIAQSDQVTIGSVVATKTYKLTVGTDSVSYTAVAGDTAATVYAKLAAAVAQLPPTLAGFGLAALGPLVGGSFRLDANTPGVGFVASTAGSTGAFATTPEIANQAGATPAIAQVNTETIKPGTATTYTLTINGQSATYAAAATDSAAQILAGLQASLSGANAAAHPGFADVTLGALAGASFTVTAGTAGTAFASSFVDSAGGNAADVATVAGAAQSAAQIADQSSWGVAIRNMTIAGSNAASVDFSNFASPPFPSAVRGFPIYLDGSPATTAAGMPATVPPTSIIRFNTDGTISTNAPSTLPGLPLTTGAATFGGAGKFTLDFGTAGTQGGLTQFTDKFAVAFLNQNGVRFGFRTGVSIDKNGLVSDVFDNGQTVPLYKLPLANFANPDELTAISGNIYSQSTASGDPVLNYAGIGGSGQLSPATLESSTVDLSTEFTNMIVVQRSYAANAKTITTTDQMLQELLAIKQ